MLELISLLCLGMAAGTLAGLLGIGGGIIIVPVLVGLFSTYPEIPNGHLMHYALGTSLATIVFTSLSSIWAHQRRKAIGWPIVWQLTPGLVVGTALGAMIANHITSNHLQYIFAIFLLLIAAQFAFGKQPEGHRSFPKWYASTFVGFVIGKISAIVGIGGGSLTVPFLTWCNISLHRAIATSAACGLPIALVGMLGYIATGWHEESTWSTGYVYWPAVLTIVPMSLLFAPIGAKLAHILPVPVLKKIFVAFLVMTGIKMLF